MSMSHTSKNNLPRLVPVLSPWTSYFLTNSSIVRCSSMFGQSLPAGYCGFLFLVASLTPFLSPPNLFKNNNDFSFSIMLISCASVRKLFNFSVKFSWLLPKLLKFGIFVINSSSKSSFRFGFLPNFNESSTLPTRLACYFN
jgi:hypothetical protein